MKLLKSLLKLIVDKICCKFDHSYREQQAGSLKFYCSALNFNCLVSFHAFLSTQIWFWIKNQLKLEQSNSRVSAWNFRQSWLEEKFKNSRIFPSNFFIFPNQNLHNTFPIPTKPKKTFMSTLFPHFTTVSNPLTRDSKSKNWKTDFNRYFSIPHFFYLGSTCTQPLYHWEIAGMSACSVTCGGGKRKFQWLCKSIHHIHFNP